MCKETKIMFCLRNDIPAMNQPSGPTGGENINHQEQCKGSSFQHANLDSIEQGIQQY
jgi:hypothetical protein